MIYEGSCVMEDWSNDAQNSSKSSLTEINDILKYIQIENSFLQIIKIFHNITVFTVFDQIKCSLGKN